jgi:hypothetical protein
MAATIPTIRAVILHRAAGDHRPDRADQLGEDEHQQQAAQQAQHPAENGGLAEAVQEVIHHHVEQDDPADDQRERHGGLEHQLGVAEQHRHQGTLAALGPVRLHHVSRAQSSVAGSALRS